MEGTDMTVLDDRPLALWAVTGGVVGERHAEARHLETCNRRVMATRPYRRCPVRPGVASLTYPGTGVRMSRAPHTRRPVSTPVSVALAGLAALITLWLGVIAHFSGDRSVAPAHMVDQLAVVQVQAGESLQQLAARVAPGRPVGQVVERIRDLNELDSASVDVGQTLIAPVG